MAGCRGVVCPAEINATALFALSPSPRRDRSLCRSAQPTENLDRRISTVLTPNNELHHVRKRGDSLRDVSVLWTFAAARLLL